MESWEKFQKLIDDLGKDTVLLEITNFFSSDTVNGFCESVAKEYDLKGYESDYSCDDEEEENF